MKLHKTMGKQSAALGRILPAKKEKGGNCAGSWCSPKAKSLPCCSWGCTSVVETGYGFCSELGEKVGKAGCRRVVWISKGESGWVIPKRVWGFACWRDKGPMGFPCSGKSFRDSWWGTTPWPWLAWSCCVSARAAVRGMSGNF